MINKIKTALYDIASTVWAMVGPKPKVARSPKWPALEKRVFERDGFKCRACGRPVKMVRLVGHHIHPVHLYPDAELVIENVLTLCQPLGGGCHLALGHTNKRGQRGWIYWNPDVVADAAEHLRRLDSWAL